VSNLAEAKIISPHMGRTNDESLMILAVNSSGCNTTTYIPAMLPCNIFITIDNSSYVHFESSPIEKSMSLPHNKVRDFSDQVSGDH
jgi:hypothetical protein